MDSSKKLISVEFEIFGLVQDVFFRKYTKKTAKRLGLVGWVINAESGTVQGLVEGPEDKVAEIKNWLENEGSPESRVDKAVFTNEKEIDKLSFESFTVNDYD
ncbi:acylphosphatase-1-like isoform X1 [Dreissena polymorpha]|nr:acylphosphatase-1-like isoform X1 [Dreissena polymorpha]